jgi:GDP-4-dehydro-6-deoxy-D-mannose reductase
MDKTILVTGTNGFVGKHLVQELKKRSINVAGVGRESDVHPSLAPFLDNYYCADLTKLEDVKKLPLEQFESVINLAGLARVGDSFSDPDKYKRINVEVFSILAEELLKLNSKCRIIAISTGSVYDSSQKMPLIEDSELIKDGSPYSLSKILMEEAAHSLRQQGLDCIVVRPFNHIGPGQEHGFLLPDLYQKIKEAQSSNSPIKVGSLKTKRDYTDVRDVAKAYVDLATTDSLTNSLYNVCSGKSIAGEEILNILLEKMNMVGKIQTIEDLDLIRPNDPKDIYGSYERLQKEIGWQPKIPLEQTIRDFVAYNTSYLF